MTRTCSACPSPITRYSKTGMCKPCALRTITNKAPRHWEWSAEEIALLREQWPALGRGCADLFPRRTIGAIETKAMSLGLRSQAKQVPWNKRAPQDSTEHMRRAARHYQGMAKRNLAKAVKLVEAGVSSSGVKHGQTRMAMIEATRLVAEQQRQADPIEQAKTVLRRRYKPVVSETIYGGTPGRFRVGAMKDVTAQDLVAMAERIRA